MEKIRYEFDPHNRLTVKSSALQGVRKVLDGQFRISGQNELTYHIKAPLPSGLKIPHQLKLRGNWSLTEKHQLRLTLDKWARDTFGESLTLQGEILDVRRSALLFAVTTRSRRGLPSVYILELSGAWQADAHNRLTFRINKQRGRFDSLVFDGAWQVNENYEISYTYQKEQLARKAKETHTLIFQGYWDIRDKARLSYVLDADSHSGFNFNTAMGIFKESYIKYELGIGISRRAQSVRRTITFSGKWRIKKGLGLVFEARQGQRKIQEIIFGAEVKLTGRDTAMFNLRNSLNKGLGAELELSQDIFSGDGQVFLRLLKSRGEQALLCGAGFRW